MLANQWLAEARVVMARIEDTQMENIQKAAELMADSIECGRWVKFWPKGDSKCISILPIMFPVILLRKNGWKRRSLPIKPALQGFSAT